MEPAQGKSYLHRAAAMTGRTALLCAGLSALFVAAHFDKVWDAEAPFQDYRYVKTRIMPTLDNAGFVTVPAGYIDGSAAPTFNGPKYQYLNGKEQKIRGKVLVPNKGKYTLGTSHEVDTIVAYRINAKEFAPVLAHPLSAPEHPPFFKAYPSHDNLDELKNRFHRFTAKTENVL